jgi:hypothetical protein
MSTLPTQTLCGRMGASNLPRSVSQDSSAGFSQPSGAVAGRAYRAPSQPSHEPHVQLDLEGSRLGYTWVYTWVYT